MKSIVRKLKDNSGATLIMALLFMLICVMISTVLLATAGTAARDVPAQRDQQKAYLAVSSAVNLLKNDIENSRFSTENSAALSAIEGDESKAAFIPLLRRSMLNAKRKSEDEWYRETFTLHLQSDGSEDSDAMDVKVTFKMNSKYRIELRCESAEKDEKGNPVYSITTKLKTKDLEGDTGYKTWTMYSASKRDQGSGDEVNT